MALCMSIFVLSSFCSSLSRAKNEWSGDAQWSHSGLQRQRIPVLFRDSRSFRHSHIRQQNAVWNLTDHHYRQVNEYIDAHRQTQKDKQAGRPAGRQADRQTGRQADRHTERQTNRHTDGRRQRRKNRQRRQRRQTKNWQY